MKLRPTAILLYQHGEMSFWEAIPMAIRLALFRSDREMARRYATVSALFRVALGDAQVRPAVRRAPSPRLVKLVFVLAFLALIAAATYHMTHGTGGVYATAVCH